MKVLRSKSGQSRTVRGPASLDPDSEEQVDPHEIVAIAEALAGVRSFEPSPGWHFDADWDARGARAAARRRLWNYCRAREIAIEIDFPWVEDLVLRLRIPNDVSKQLFVGGRIDPNEFCFLKERLRPGMVVVDVGANEGIYSVFSSRVVGSGGEVIAFEPSSRERAALEANIRRNAIRNVRVHACALGARPGSGRLRIAEAEHAGHNSLGALPYDGVAEAAVEEVRIEQLDRIIEAEGVKRLDVIKVDVEGFDLKVLRGASGTLERFRPAVLFESSHQGHAASGDAASSLGELGYQIFGFDPSTGLPSREYAAGENLIALAD